MKRWLIFLSWPWLVYTSTAAYEDGLSVTHYYARHQSDEGDTAVQCGEQLEACRDVVAAFNMGHESRIENAPPPATSKKKLKLKHDAL